LFLIGTTPAFVGSLKKERTKYKNHIAMGDWVRVEKNSEDSGVIVHIEERRSFLIRSEHLFRHKYHFDCG